MSLFDVYSFDYYWMCVLIDEYSNIKLKLINEWIKLDLDSYYLYIFFFFVMWFFKSY